MKFRIPLVVVYSAFLAGCIGSVQLSTCSQESCEETPKESKEIKVAFENLSESVTIGLSAGASGDDTILEIKSSDGESVSFSALLGKDEFATLSVTDEPDNQICTIQGDNVVKSSDITNGYTVTVSCVDANLLPLVGYSVLGDLTLRIDEKEDFVVLEGATDITVKTVGVYTYDSAFKITSQPEGKHCKINRLSDTSKALDSSRIPLEIYCFEKAVPVVDVVVNLFGWTLLRADGLAVSFGLEGLSPYYDTTGVRAALFDVAALSGGVDGKSSLPGGIKKDGTVAGWVGDGAVTDLLDQLSATNVKELYSNGNIALAYTHGGEIVSVGDVKTDMPVDVGQDVKSIHLASEAIIVHKADGTLSVIGDDKNKDWQKAFGSSFSGDLSNVEKYVFGNNNSAAAQGLIVLQNTPTGSEVIALSDYYSEMDDEIKARLTDVIDIASNFGSVVALNKDGTLAAWGDKYAINVWKALRERDGARGDDSMAQWVNMQTDVKSLFTNQSGAYAAIKADGSVIAFGGDELNNSIIGADLLPVKDLLVDVKNIIPSRAGFFAQKNDGSVIYWGRTDFAIGQSIFIDGEPLQLGEMPGLAGATKILDGGFSAGYIALKPDGTVVSGGMYADGLKDGFISFASVKSELYDITDIYSAGWAYGALRSDGTFVTWGTAQFGGDSSEFHKELNR